MNRVDRFRQTSIMGALAFLSFAFLSIDAIGEKTAPVERAYYLPCKVTSFTQSGDGELIWFACGESRTQLYALDIPIERVTALTEVEGPIQIFAAPVGRQMILVRSDNHDPVLYDGGRKVAEIPLDADLLVWSSDASKIYFYGGSTTQEDAVNFLGVLRLEGLLVSRKKLLAHMGNLTICSASGHIFTGDDPMPNDKAELEAVVFEYDADVKVVSRVTKFPPGEFSATCRYMATLQSAHGPIPWEIIDVASGRRLMRFGFTGETSNRGFGFHSWNPKRDEILLRFKDDATLQIFNLKQHRVQASFNSLSENIAWSRDGRNLVFSRGNSVVFRKW